MVSKADWRRRVRQARLEPVGGSLPHVKAIALFLAAPDRTPGWVVTFDAIAGEVDLSTLVDDPVLGPFAITRTPDTGPDGSADLTVHPFDSPRERHRYGFEQPVAEAPIVADEEISVVLVPGLVFDRRGGRLGRGKGYYDRFLARLGPGTALVGVTGGHVVAEVPTDDHDVSMTHLAGGFGVVPVPLAGGIPVVEI